MLTTEEAARRLGVKVPTLYAYVSRGLLDSHPDPARRGSLFDLGEVESLATRSRGGRQTATRLATITTAVTQLDQQTRPDLSRPGRHRAGTVLQLRRGGRAPLAVRGTGRLDRARPRPMPAHPDAGAHALGAGALWSDRSASIRPAPFRGRPRRPPRHRRPDRRRGPCAPRAGLGRLRGGAAHRPPHADRCCGARRRRERRPRPLGGPRARHLDDGRARGGVGPLRPLRRAVGRAGHAGRTAARRCKPASLRAAGDGRA